LHKDAKHLTLAELEAGLGFIARSPKDSGPLELIVRLPAEDEREIFQEGHLDNRLELTGDTWISRGVSGRPGGSADPKAQMPLGKGLTAPACEAASYLAACAVAQGQPDEARTYVHEAWEYLKTRGSGMMENPAKTNHTCIEVFEALGETENARAALESGYQALMQKADTLTVPEWRRSCLENVPDNRALMEMWERGKV
jgi:hypothetical protein